MRRKRVLRLIYACFFLGAFLGLIFGLAFGQNNGSGTLKLVEGGSASADSPQTTVAVDTAAGQVMTPERAKLIGANEMGLVLVIVYNKISSETSDSTTRTPDQLRGELALLDSEGFYPINVSDLVTGDIDIPAGKFPVAITFDGSSPGQYRILDDGTIDPSCAVGVMQNLIDGGYWHPKATFFCLLDVVPNENEVFGQRERQKEKLRNLVDWGYEVGSNTMTNLDLSSAPDDSIRSQLANSQIMLQELIGSDYAVSSLALPYGRFPKATALLSSGTWQDGTTARPYQYTAAVGHGETPCPSPFSTNFQPMHIPRIASAGENLSAAIDALKNRPELLYISDGDPTAVSAPATLDSSLGQPRDNLGRPVIRY